MIRRIAICLLAVLALLPCSLAEAQGGPTGRIAGVVTATETGQPLAGAHVTVIGTRAGAVTGADGRYLIPIAPGTYTVRASMIGFGPVAVADVPVVADSLVTVDFRLRHQAVELEQVVTIGYGTQQKKDVTGAVGVVSEEALKTQQAQNIGESLKGRVAGVDIVTTGNKPGDSFRIRIRGTRSLRASNDPLYVLDGIPLAGGIGDIPSTDIESVQILKDASATAIYGSRGANGVVLITTKQAKAGQTTFDYEAYGSIQQPLRRVDMMTGPEFAELKRESRRTTNHYICPGGQTVCGSADSAIFYPEELAALQSGRWTDWQDLIIQRGTQFNNQLRIAGGDEKTRFSMSMSQFHQDGVVKSQWYLRRSLRMNFEHHASTRFRFGNTTTLVRSTQNLGRGDAVYGEALGVNPLGMAYDTRGALLFKPVPDGQRVNPLSDIQNHRDERVRTRIFGTLYGEYDLMEGLNWRVNFGPDLTFARQGVFRGAFTAAHQGSGNDASINDDRTLAFTFDNILSYRRSLGADHRFDVTGLYSIEKNKSDSHDTGVDDVLLERQEWFSLGSGRTVSNVGSGLSEWALQSYMGRVNYAFKDRYLLTLSTRVDGSSRLAEGHKYAVFPSVALGWRLVNEPWIARTGIFSDLKLRASYGETGNTAISPYQTQAALSRIIYSFGDAAAPGLRPSVLGNPDLRWERTAQNDVGLEFAVLKGRVSGTVDAYWAKTRDLLMDRVLPSSIGFSSILQNVGVTRNTGVEVGLSTVNVENWKGLHWTTDFIWSTNKNRIVSLFGGQGSDVGNRWFIGKPIEVYYDQRFLGIWQLGADPAVLAKLKQKPGEIRVLDVNGDTVINEKDRLILGSNYPEWTGSVATRLDYRGFDFSALVVTRQHFMVNNTFRTSQNQLFGRYNNLRVNYWTPTNPSNTDPRPNEDQESPPFGGTRAYEDGSFVRVRNITLGYTVPDQWRRQVRARSMRLYLTAQDPFLFTKFKGLDPESRTSSGVPSYYSLLGGVNIGL
ncbi:MAG TPA: TonB-dependent receptor [Gemmatimonadaceae bacterium]|nr:TonB-dependent receptor [Gemmatimonadaceae bacterium]